MWDLPDDIKGALKIYTDRGVKIFPILCNAKIPRTGWHWKTKNSTDLAVLAEWATPNCNWAAMTGPESGILVIDVDPKHGGMKWYETNKHRLPRTFTVKTPSGGLHLYFRYPQFEVSNHTNGELAPGVDIKGKGGYVLIPPSCVGRGGWYRVEDDSPWVVQ